MSNSFGFGIIVFLFTLQGCIDKSHYEGNQPQKNQGKIKQEKVVKEGLVRIEQGAVVKEIFYKDGKKNGLAKQYYVNGKPHMEITYKDDLKHGPYKWFYQDGGIYEHSNFINGKKDGLVKLFYPDGKIKAEIPYKNGQPGIGLIEYNKSGKVTPSSELIIEEIDRIALGDEFILKVYFRDKKSKAKFYTGELTEGRFKNNSLIPVETKNGVGEIKIHVPPGLFIMNKINIVGEYPNADKNLIIKQKTYNLSVENRQ